MRSDADFEPLLTERLLLRRSLPEDAEAISAYRSDPEVHRYQGWERTDPQSIRGEIGEMTGRAPGEPDGWVQLSVLEREGGRLVGDVGLSRAEGEPGVIKVGYTMARAFQGAGYGTEAVGALVDYVFDVLGADVVRAYADQENIPSIRVAEKVGMRLVERFERRYGDELWHGVRYERRRSEHAGFVPAAFVPPAGMATDVLVLEPLGPEHNERDHAAWMSSIEHIHATPGFDDPTHPNPWPEPMTLGENLADLEMHARHLAHREGFTYTVLDPASRDVIGCVYIYPAEDGVHDASVRSWVRVSHAHLDEPLWRAVSDWLERDWPFERLAYASRD
jgi:RimJ/RimL family protein N-acetyltransferase